MSEDLINLKLFTVAIENRINVINQALGDNNYDIGIIEEALKYVKEDVETAIKIVKVFSK